MGNFSLLVEKRFWLKLLVLSWWSAMLGTYIWFLSFVGKSPSLLDSWLSVVVSTVVAGAGFNHITNLFKIPVARFSLDFGFPVFFVTLGAVLFIVGVCLAIRDTLWAQIVGNLYALLSVIFIVMGSDTAPKQKQT